MKNKIRINNWFLIPVISLIFFGCEYQEIADSKYPDQRVYLPSAINSPYIIDDVPQTFENVPTPRTLNIFYIDKEASEFIIPLGVARGGITLDGTIRVNIMENSDAVSGMINAGTLQDVELIPESQVIMDESIEIKSGQETAVFLVKLSLDLLTSSSADETYVFGVEIDSPDRETNEFTTAVIGIRTNIFYPLSDFKALVNPQTKLIARFENNSEYGVRWEWDFGDGQSSTLKDPVHTYANAGTYSVKLTTYGILGEEYSSVASKDLVIKP